MPYLVDIPERTDYCFNLLFFCLEKGNGEVDLRVRGRVKRGGKYSQHIMYERRKKS